MIMIVHNHLDTKQNRYRLDTIDKYFLSGKQKLSVDAEFHSGFVIWSDDFHLSDKIESKIKKLKARKLVKAKQWRSHYNLTNFFDKKFQNSNFT